MSELLQSGEFPGAAGHHPDADQLSAFLEQALSLHEREQVLAHLAVCPDCRETVALSLPQPEAAPIPEPTGRSWLRAWSVFVPAALALAASVIFLVHVRQANRGAGEPVQPAQTAVVQPPAPIAPPALAPSVPRPEETTRAANRVAPLPAASLVEPRQLDEFDLAPPARAPAAMPVAKAEPAEPPTTQAPANGLAVGLTAGAELSADAPAPTPPPPSAKAPLASAAETVAVINEAPVPDTSSASLDQLSPAAPAVRAVVLKHPLPSRLEVLSVVAKGRAFLAIDAHNAVFLSGDSGAHWTAVSAPWQGRAVNVHLVSDGVVHAPAAGALQSGRMANFASVSGPRSALKPSITGVVTDTSGAVIAGAAVTLHNAATSAERTVVTDANGSYIADDLAPGGYSIKANARGFIEQRLSNVEVEASRQTTQDITLQVGSVSEAVTVDAAAQPVAKAGAPEREALQSPSAVAAPPTVFEIVTDTGEHWISTDGIAWSRR